MTCHVGLGSTKIRASDPRGAQPEIDMKRRGNWTAQTGQGTPSRRDGGQRMGAAASGPNGADTLRAKARLSSTLANFSSSSSARNAEHRIVLDDVVGTLKHEFHAAEGAKGAPATMDIGPIKQLEATRIGDGAQPGDGI